MINQQTLHKLRHTNATLLLNSGVDIKIVSEHLGHSDISITANTYTAVLDNSRANTSYIIEEILSHTNTKQAPSNIISINKNAL